MIGLRLATTDDWKILYTWRNHPQTRKWMRNQNRISVSHHRAWLEDVLADPDRFVFIGRQKGVDSGMIRADLEDDGFYELSYIVAPERRNRGIATDMVIEVQKMLEPVRGIIKEDNAPSIRVAVKAGLVPVGRDEGMIIYESKSYGITKRRTNGAVPKVQK